MNAPYPKQLAFPVPDSKGTPATNGMLLMDYFAAHAPQEIPAWFKHPDQFEIPQQIGRDQALNQQPGYSQLSEAEQKEVHDYLTDPWEDAPEALVLMAHAALDAAAKRREEIGAAICANEGARYFAWRWHYARNMILTRP